MKHELLTCASAAAVLFGANFVASPVSAAPTDSAAESQATATNSQKKTKITDRSHPDYMRCRTETIIGSRARTRKMCMTNREWEEFARAGNAGARSILDDVNKGGIRQE